MSIRHFLPLVQRGPRRVRPIEENEMVAQCMEALIDERDADTIYGRICEYGRIVSGSLATALVFFTDENLHYTVNTLCCSDKRFCEELTTIIPLKPGTSYDLDQIRGIARLVDGHGRIAHYATLRHFIENPLTEEAVARSGLLKAIHTVLVYPVQLEKSIKGALLFFSRHRRVNVNGYRIFALQCSLVFKHGAQIDKLEEMRRLQEQLHQGQKMEAIGQLAGGIAHDFNNMLAGISGYAYLIKRKFGGKEPELNSFVDAIITASKRAADLTTKLLAFARKGKYQTVSVDIHATVREVIALLERTLDRRIEIVEELHAKPSTVLGDPTQLQNMVLNLAINSRDAMPAGGRLIFKTESRQLPGGPSKDGRYEVKAGQYLIMSVIDTGMGMDEPTRKRLFEPFFTTKEVGKGTGLGLASVYGMVKSHNGFISVDSEKGKGAAFTVYLPQSGNEAPILIPPKTELIVHGRGRILVVDDEEMVRNLSKEVLTFIGYSVDTCVDGFEAVAHFGKHFQEIDLVLLDLIMPKMDGYETFREMQKIKPDVKVVIATGYTLKGDTQTMISRGISGFVQKPFESGPLSQVIADVLSGKIAGLHRTR